MPTDSYSKKSKYPSVTRVLSPFSNYDTIHPTTLGRAAERGTVVHSHCSAYLLGQWTPPPNPDYRGYVESARQWIDTFVDEVLLVEQELEDHELQFCGHPDTIVRSAKLGGVLLIDWKTPAQVHRKNWGAQLAAYERLAKANGYPAIDRIGALRLNKDGSMARFDEFTENRLAFWNAFFAALVAYRFFN